MSILLTFIVIGVIATVHELGHFWMAKREGILVRELSLGIGPKIFQTRRGQTSYSLRVFPFFAYVQMGGMMPEEQEMENGYLSKRPAQKARVLVAGSFMNVVLAIVIFIVLFMGIGVFSDAPDIGAVYDGSPAMEAGLQAGDRVVAIDGRSIDSWNDMIGVIGQSADETLSFAIQRGDQSLQLDVTPQQDPGSDRALIGIERSRERLGPIQAIAQGVWQSVAFVGIMISALAMMITGQAPAELSGPVGIAGMVGEASSAGVAGLLFFTAILSLNLAILNLLPFPALDGGKLVLVAIEKIRGKRLDTEKEVMINVVGFAILIGIMLFATYNDILNLFTGR